MATGRYRRFMTAAVAIFTLAAGLFAAREALAQDAWASTTCRSYAEIRAELGNNGGTEVADLHGDLAHAIAGVMAQQPPMPFDELLIVNVGQGPLLAIVMAEDCALAVSRIYNTPDEVLDIIRRVAPEA
jgi:hypothetical protein